MLAVVAVARKLAVLLHAMWSDGTVYQADGPPTVPATVLPAAVAADLAAVPCATSAAISATAY